MIGGLLSIPVRTYMHELGHMLAFKILYENAHPLISLRGYGFLGGSCQPNFRTSHLWGLWESRDPIQSSLGKSLEEISPGSIYSVAAAAGPLVDIVSLLALSHFSKRSEAVRISQHYVSSALLTYAISAIFWDKEHCNGHDFCEIWAHSGFLAYGTMMAACLATYLYVHRRLYPLEARIKEVMLSSLLIGCAALYLSQGEFLSEFS